MGGRNDPVVELGHSWDKKVNSNYYKGKGGTKELLPFFWRNSHTQEYTPSAHLDLMSDCEACVCVLVGGGKGIFM